MERPLDSLEQGDRIEVAFTDGSEIVGLVQNDPDTGPPHTPDGHAAGWDEKTLLGGVHAEERDGSVTKYESLMLSQERHGEEWRNLTVRGYYHTDGGYEDDDLTDRVEEVEVRE